MIECDICKHKETDIKDKPCRNCLEYGINNFELHIIGTAKRDIKKGEIVNINEILEIEG